MSSSVFVELRFWLLVVSSLIVPALTYWSLMRRRAIGRGAVLLLGVLLVSISAIAVYLLQSLKGTAEQTLSNFDNLLFASEMSIALYTLPILFGGVGVNLVSHLLIEHLLVAERRADEAAP
jgi:hypothetical protein